MGKKLEERIENSEIAKARAFWAKLEGSASITYEKAEENAKRFSEDLDKSEITIDRLFAARYMGKVSKYENQENRKFTYARIDLDEMTRINETYGTDVGDLVIASALDVIKLYLEGNDVNYRLKLAESPVSEKMTVGDQIILMLNENEMNAQEDLWNIQDQIRLTLAKKIYDHISGELRLSPELVESLKKEEFTFGVGAIQMYDVKTHYTEVNPCSSATLLEDLATKKLQVAKKIGKNQYIS
jgi:GGDEF domain-containing protein